MPESRLLLNSTQIPNMILDELLPTLSGAELKVLMIISRQTYGWHKESEWIAYSQFEQKTGLNPDSISTALKSLKEKNIIQVYDRSGQQLIEKGLSGRRQLFYRVNYQNSENPSIQTENSENPNFKTRKIEVTKETNTKDNIINNITRSAKKPTCPLLVNETLKTKWPNGHKECVEYVTGYKFVNMGKQFRFLHQMLRTGLDFPDIDRLIVRVEKRPFFKENGWDFATIASEADRRATNASH